MYKRNSTGGKTRQYQKGLRNNGEGKQGNRSKSCEKDNGLVQNRKTKSAMNKSRKAKSSYNRDIIKMIQNKYRCTPDYIRKSIRGDRVGSISILIREEYERLNDKVVQVINIEAQKL
ncbi:hypothetical protein ACFFLS_00715 [Flavobacterium procerum]|uniref:Uncharacterized protein n=1 Tax=Flavobacterium procerum TaxID=1455569 RepID=A0ABV6BJB4_9FLAO